MKAIWTGNLNFGLVNIPVKVVSAVDSQKLELDLVHKEDMCNVGYKYVCKETGKAVDYSELVKAYNLDGNYIVLNEEDFQKAAPEKLKVISIDKFTSPDNVETQYFKKPYYLVPDEEKGADKLYALVLNVLKRTGKVGIAKFVLKNRENLGVIRPEGNILVLNQIRYESELKDAPEVKIPEKSKLGKEELETATKLVNKLSSDFNPKEYKDTYTEELLEVIKDKAAGREKAKEEKEIEPTQIEDLMKKLIESLEVAKVKS